MTNQELSEISVIDSKKIFVPNELKRVFDNFEQLSVTYLKRMVGKGDVFVDVGANFGFYSVLASVLVGECGKVISVEPSPATLAILINNVSSYANVSVAPYAVSTKSGYIDFYHTDDYVNSGSVANPPFIADGKVSKISVASRRLDDILNNEFGVKTIDFLKIDVQGDDINVLDSCVEVLDRSKKLRVLVEWAPTWMINAGWDPFDLPDKLTELGFNNILCIDDWLNKSLSIEEFYRSYEEDKSGKRFCNLLAYK